MMRGLTLHIVDLNGEAVDTSTTMGRFFLTLMGALAEMERGLISERTTEAMNQLRATNKQFTKSIFGWDVNRNGMFIPNWFEQDIIDYMAWQVEHQWDGDGSCRKVAQQTGHYGQARREMARQFHHPNHQQ